MLSNIFFHILQAHAFHSAYRPMTLEERVKRAYAKQLQNQWDTFPSKLEIIHANRKKLLGEQAAKDGLPTNTAPLSPIPVSNDNSKQSSPVHTNSSAAEGVGSPEVKGGRIGASIATAQEASKTVQ